jgi:hypothetical protein
VAESRFAFGRIERSRVTTRGELDYEASRVLNSYTQKVSAFIMSYFRHSSSRNEENSEKEPRKKTETLVRTNWGEIEMAKCEAGWLAGLVRERKCIEERNSN